MRISRRLDYFYKVECFAIVADNSIHEIDFTLTAKINFIDALQIVTENRLDLAIDKVFLIEKSILLKSKML